MAHPTTTRPRITVGVDTHLDVHVAHACDQLGRRVATVQVPTTPAGYQDLLAWARGLGEVEAWGVEGTGSYGAALARFLHAEGQVEMIRSLRVGRQTAMRARTQTINALPALLVTAPAELREQLRGLSVTWLVRAAAELEPGPITSPLAAAMLALHTLAGRYQALSAEITTLTTELDRLTRAAAPRLVALFGVGQDSAGALLVAAGDNPGRLRSDACFSMLCGSSPIEASSGKTRRHRLNRGGDRQANAALYRIVVVRLRWHQPTKDYMARRLKEGKTTKEIIRCFSATSPARCSQS